MAENTALSVLLLSVFVFLFFKYCLGDNTTGEELQFTPQGDKCPVGTVYSTHRQGCKDIVMSNKREIGHSLSAAFSGLPSSGFSSSADHMTYPRSCVRRSPPKPVRNLVPVCNQAAPPLYNEQIRVCVGAVLRLGHPVGVMLLGTVVLSWQIVGAVALGAMPHHGIFQLEPQVAY
ncbi:hypothetical protein J6590_056173 [Homalodisca vitripennis]|nr:hypothetical protein J6590_056173 [Homalodisca vitripennis]